MSSCYNTYVHCIWDWLRHISIVVFDTILCDKVCKWLAAGLWFSLVFSANKTDRHDITEILLKVALNIITITNQTDSHDTSNNWNIAEKGVKVQWHKPNPISFTHKIIL
jgi:hypothetical protein